MQQGHGTKEVICHGSAVASTIAMATKPFPSERHSSNLEHFHEHLQAISVLLPVPNT